MNTDMEHGDGETRKLKLTGLDVGLLVNFNTPVLRRGIRRLVRRGADGVRLARFRTAEDDPTVVAGLPESTRPEAPTFGPVRSSG